MYPSRRAAASSDKSSGIGRSHIDSLSARVAETPSDFQDGYRVFDPMQTGITDLMARGRTAQNGQQSPVLRSAPSLEQANNSGTTVSSNHTDWQAIALILRSCITTTLVYTHKGSFTDRIIPL